MKGVVELTISQLELELLRENLGRREKLSSRKAVALTDGSLGDQNG